MIATVEDRSKGDAICARLKELGYQPAWMEVCEGQLVIGIDIMTMAPNWTKAFRHELVTATPQAFVQMMNEWKAKVRKEIHIGLPSLVVQRCIATWGLPAVWTALKSK